MRRGNLLRDDVVETYDPSEDTLSYYTALELADRSGPAVSWLLNGYGKEELTQTMAKPTGFAYKPCIHQPDIPRTIKLSTI